MVFLGGCGFVVFFLLMFVYLFGRWRHQIGFEVLGCSCSYGQLAIQKYFLEDRSNYRHIEDFGFSKGAKSCSHPSSVLLLKSAC